MNRHIIVAGAIALATGGSLAAWAAEVPSTAAREEFKIRRLDADWVQAVQAKDLDKILGFYASGGSMMADRAPIATGTDAIRATWQHVLAIPGFKLSFTPTHIDVAKARDMASEIGTFTESAADSSGKVNTTVGKYVVVWRKQPDGQWRVTADIFNSDP
jgi:uncharacterized protein (TIGR02246 family)